MANNLNIPERTLAQIADETDSINVIGGLEGRRWAYEPIVCRVSDHVANDGAEADDPFKMAIFLSKRHGEPWMKEDNSLVRKIHGPADGLTPETDVTCIYPNFDYTTFV